ncbi:MAG: VCBS repeat-containing protein [Anaerolineales bacterium]|nr:VCBS repeat-containing protein [Anaerolineales bacterium]
MLAGLLLAGWLLTASLARAAGYTVTKTVDTNDGVCDADCSLREALAAANAAPDPDTIFLPAGLYPLSLGELSITSPLTLTGELSTSTIINAAPGVPVMTVMIPGMAIIANVTVQGGNSVGAGGINAQGPLTLNDSILTHNTGVIAGGVSGGQVAINRSWIVDNTAGLTGLGGGVSVSNDGVVTITASLIAGNTGGKGGGLYNTGTLTLIDTRVENNFAYGAGGGGLYNERVTAANRLALTTSTFQGNQSASEGGGLLNHGGPVTIADSRFLFNGSGLGGAIWNTGALTVTRSAFLNSVGGGIVNSSAPIPSTWLAAAGSLSLTNSTLAGAIPYPGDAVLNGAGAGVLINGGAGYLNNVTITGNAGAGVFQSNTAVVSVTNSLLAGNYYGDCRGTLTSLDYNFFQNLACTLTGAAAHTLSSLDPLVALPQDNGGPTLTQPLLAGSPALDAGNPAAPGSAGACAAVDQRGAARPADTACDIGASEGAYADNPLVIARAASNEPVALGQAFTETVIVTNTGVSLLSNVRVTETLPASVQFGAFGVNTGSCAVTGSAVACGPTALAAGAALRFSVVVTPGAVGTLAGMVAAADDAQGAGMAQTQALISTTVTLLAQQVGTAWPKLNNGGAAWGDYDGDGRLDAVVLGDTGAGLVTRVYHNLGGGVFTITASLTGVAYGSAAWGDFDNDGHLDLLITGATVVNAYPQPPANPATRLYRGDGAGAFTPVSAGLADVMRGAGVWADYDGDGRADILLTGQGAAGPVTKLYQNGGGGVFTEVAAGFPGLLDSAAAWGDYNHDGRPDLFLAGNTGAAQAASALWRNAGNGFTQDVDGLRSSNPPQTITVKVDRGAVAWADADNDGWLDLAAAGGDGSGQGYGSLFFLRNQGGQLFYEYFAAMPPQVTTAWGDYDNDGRPDLVLAGLYGQGTLFHTEGRAIFADTRASLEALNLAIGDYNADGRLDLLAVTTNAAGNYRGTTTLQTNLQPARNTPPMAPAGLTVTISGATATLSWNAAADAETPAAGLSYNIRVGTMPGGVDVVSPLADLATGFRYIPALGNAGQLLTATVTGLTPGLIYYWSVQAIDAGWLASPFAAEGNFDLSGGLTPTATPTLTPTATVTPAATLTPTATAVPGAGATPPASLALEGPTLGVTGTAYVFQAAATPLTATLPMTYHWQASAQAGLAITGGLSSTASFQWDVPGLQTITATAWNASGAPVTATHTISIVAGAATGLTPAQPGSLIYTDTHGGVIHLLFPAAAITQAVDLILAPVVTVTAPAGFGFAGQAFELHALAAGVPAASFVFQSAVTVTLNYLEAAVSQIGEDTLKLFYRQGNTWVDAATTCAPASHYVRDLINNRLEVAICHLSEFALFGQPQFKVYLPAVVSAH